MSLAFWAILYVNGGHDFRLPGGAIFWAVLAGLAIGAAEIGYFYLFAGIGMIRPVSASIAVPIVVSGAIVISRLAAWLVFDEAMGGRQILGAGYILLGTTVLFSDKLRQLGHIACCSRTASARGTLRSCAAATD